jgi:hypothetical protein
MKLIKIKMIDEDIAEGWNGGGVIIPPGDE